MLTKIKASVAMDDVDPQHVFWMCDGTVLKNMNELHDAFSRIDDAAYFYHANENKNDFANWVMDIIHDSKLAADLRKAKSRKDAQTAVKKRVVHHRKR